MLRIAEVTTIKNSNEDEVSTKYVMYDDSPLIPLDVEIGIVLADNLSAFTESASITFWNNLSPIVGDNLTSSVTVVNNSLATLFNTTQLADI
jgi:hypothetical protein